MDDKHTLVYRERVAREQGAVSLIFTPDERFKWSAGQAITIKLDLGNVDENGNERTFAISSAPAEGYVMITTKGLGEDSSAFKSALLALEEGDSIECSKPFFSEGKFEAENPALDYIFLVGGIGITPVRAIMKEFELGNKQLKGTLLYMNRDDEYIFGEELDEVAKKFARFTVQPYHTRAIDEDVVTDLHMRYPTGVFEVSGPQVFIDEVVELLEDVGIPERNIRYYSFSTGYSEI